LFHPFYSVKKIHFYSLKHELLMYIDSRGIINGTAQFKKYKQLFQYQHLLLLRDICGQISNLYLIVVHFLNTSVN
jgi:hypothetical protein